MDAQSKLKVGQRGTRRIVRLLRAFAKTMHMIGEYIREASVLIVVFIPIEFWHSGEVFHTRDFFLHILPSSVLLLIVGIYIEHLSCSASELAEELEVDLGS